MCLYISQKEHYPHNRAHIAEEDIFVLKKLVIHTDVDGTRYLLSPHRGYKWEVDKLNVPVEILPIREMDDIINEGYHAYISYYRFNDTWWPKDETINGCAMFVAKIPKGTKYYLSDCFYGNREIVAEQMILTTLTKEDLIAKGMMSVDETPIPHWEIDGVEGAEATKFHMYSFNNTEIPKDDN